MSKQLLSSIEEMIQPILDTRGLELYDLKLVNEGPNRFLRIYIDHEKGIDLDECSIVSELVSEKLDKEDPIKGAYFLEVSSPGAEKPLRNLDELKSNIGKNVFVSLYVHIDGEKQYEGILKSVVEDIITIEYKFKAQKKLVELPYDKIAKARLAVML